MVTRTSKKAFGQMIMTPFKMFCSFLLLSIASANQGRGRFEKVIHVANIAKKISPTSKMILKGVYTFICDDYRRIREYDKAIIASKEALEVFPEDTRFNQLMVMALVEKDEPIDKSIPYIKKYFENYEKIETKFPKIMKPIVKLFRKDFDLAVYAEEINKCDSEWTVWAKNVLENYKQ